MNAAQIAAFAANSGGTSHESVAAVLVGLLFAALLLWGAWAIYTAYAGWAENQLNQRQLAWVCIRFVVTYAVLTFFLLS